jgi:hypothetical protein
MRRDRRIDLRRFFDVQSLMRLAHAEEATWNLCSSAGEIDPHMIASVFTLNQTVQSKHFRV